MSSAILTNSVKVTSTTMGQNAAGQSTAGQNTADQNVAGQIAADQNATVQNTTDQNTVDQTAAGQNAVDKNTADKNTPDEVVKYRNLRKYVLDNHIGRTEMAYVMDLLPVRLDDPTKAVPSEIFIIIVEFLSLRSFARYLHHLSVSSGFLYEYCSGKVAWHEPGSGYIIVDNLRLRTRKVLAPPTEVETMSRSPLRLLALGSRLVVASVGKMIIAWDHIDNQTHQQLLASEPFKCATHKNNVAIHFQGMAVIIWTPGQPAVHIPSQIPQPRIFSTDPSVGSLYQGVFFNTHEKETLYVISVDFVGEDDDLMVHITADEFSGINHKATYKFERPAPHNLATSLDDRSTEGLKVLEYDFDFSQVRFYSAEHTIIFDKLERQFAYYKSREKLHSSIPRPLWQSLFAFEYPDLDFVLRPGRYHSHYKIIWLDRVEKRGRSRRD
ncbi:hypothetical protein NPX13_g9533 [Xylaria arbuscula]|uniref:Uncharacterized protein n=1 Tax=Xylaria arbuscula TaxID=114810 RepID=A0A9W8N6I4_9PEZI|nr:hypothetical protein NPX13_g9533 [Xylaria arbuscula]